MRQTMREFQDDYFTKQGYVLFDNLDSAIVAFRKVVGVDKDEAWRRIISDANADWIVLNSGKIAVLKGDE